MFEMDSNPLQSLLLSLSLPLEIKQHESHLSSERPISTFVSRMFAFNVPIELTRLFRFSIDCTQKFDRISSFIDKILHIFFHFILGHIFEIVKRKNNKQIFVDCFLSVRDIRRIFNALQPKKGYQFYQRF